MYAKLKQNQYWIWSSERASKDCLPLNKVDHWLGAVIYMSKA